MVCHIYRVAYILRWNAATYRARDGSRDARARGGGERKALLFRKKTSINCIRHIINAVWSMPLCRVLWGFSINYLRKKINEHEN